MPPLLQWILGLALPPLLAHAVWATRTILKLQQKIFGADDANGLAGDVTELKDDHAALDGRVSSIEQEMYGAKGDNGWRKHLRILDEEQAYQGSLTHWIANLTTVIADKAGVVNWTERPKRGEQRR